MLRSKAAQPQRRRCWQPGTAAVGLIFGTVACIFATSLPAAFIGAASSRSTAKLPGHEEAISRGGHGGAQHPVSSHAVSKRAAQRFGVRMRAASQQPSTGTAPSVLLLHPDDGAPGFVESAVANGMVGASWAQAAQQIAERVLWDLSSPAEAELQVMSLQSLCSLLAIGSASYDAVLGIDLIEPPPAKCKDAVSSLVTGASARLFISSSRERHVGSFWQNLTELSGASARDLDDAGPLGVRAALGGWTEASKMKADVEDLWHRRTAEEAVYALFVFIDSALAPLAAIQMQKPVPTFETLTSAVDRCQDAFRACFTSPRCLQSLACLSQCGLADQSCSYNCIVSYQTEAFTQFSLCALQKNNLLNSQVERPDTPQPQVLESFRGQPLSAELAENILVGHFDPSAGRRHSWLVAAGSNPAYEQFAWQYQLWYKGTARGSFWYHPTFLVETLDGRKIWRTRDYRVRRTKAAGIWEFSVLDNGIISEEKWHLLGADDDMSWIVLFYVGAARRAGIFYRGCLVLTPDGEMPTNPNALVDISAAVGRAGMKMWELERCHNPPQDVDNPPPLIAPETQPAAPLLQHLVV